MIVTNRIHQKGVIVTSAYHTNNPMVQVADVQSYEFQDRFLYFYNDQSEMIGYLSFDVLKDYFITVPFLDNMVDALELKMKIDPVSMVPSDDLTTKQIQQFFRSLKQTP